MQSLTFSGAPPPITAHSSCRTARNLEGASCAESRSTAPAEPGHIQMRPHLERPFARRYVLELRRRTRRPGGLSAPCPDLEDAMEPSYHRPACEAAPGGMRQENGGKFGRRGVHPRTVSSLHGGLPAQSPWFRQARLWPRWQSIWAFGCPKLSSLVRWRWSLPEVVLTPPNSLPQYPDRFLSFRPST